MITLTPESFPTRTDLPAGRPPARPRAHAAGRRRVRFTPTDEWVTRNAAARYGVDAALIAAVLADEQVRLDGYDHLQHRLLRLTVSLPERPASALRHLAGWLAGRPVETFSLGRAQMKVGTLRRLGVLGYLEVPPELPAQLRLLLDPLAAPRLVAACLRATADHWAGAGVPIAHRPDILATLYSLGFTGRRGVHPHPRASERGRLIAEHAAWLDTGAPWSGDAAAPGRAAPVTTRVWEARPRP
ncbi:hypothetical protein DAETH_45930 (plasmid) [Deinococcus aetherius]|uniref:Uncharacterized protein n=1 Tax=Deinococcus aetherius TaxID=200252 RepID=A0ABM8ALC1_9DEIO|nr:hypothetical protein [Deinococcus aetherius]BDP44624.1 hypothetical protein DAETH_45930 [Deinococcus aetherius]